MFGCGNSIASGRVHHDHATSCRCLDIDVVDANARATDNTQLRRRIQNRARNFRLTTHDNGTEIGNNFHELAFRQTCLRDDLQFPLARKFLDTTR